LQDKRYELTPKTSFEEFLPVMQCDRRTSNIDPDSMTLIFERLREKVLKRHEEDKYHAEKHQRRAIDTLRSYIKHLRPSITTADTWDTVRPRIEKADEYRALDDDELRRSAFEKHMRRLKEREEDEDRDRERRLRDRDRDSRDYRNGHGSAAAAISASSRRRTRSPEIDAYEADRKKAMADRERSYRKSSVTGLSPPPSSSAARSRYDDRERGGDRERDRYESRDHERDRERERDQRRREISSYDRERREREMERERSYISRADPRDKGSALDYGDSREGSMSLGATRRRRESEGSAGSKRDSKRVRRERERERTKTPGVGAEVKKEEKEDVGFKSGSEEGEIEEE